MITRKAYGISSELGELTTASHIVESKGKTLYNSGTTFFEVTCSREKFKSIRFKELCLDYSTDTSTRKTADRLNRIRLEEKGISPTTYRNIIEREGAAIQERMTEKCESSLKCNGFDNNGTLAESGAFAPNEGRHIDQAVIESAAIDLNIWDYNASDYESPIETTYVSVDDVGVKRQTETRPKDEGVQQPKRVDNTVVHVQSGRKRYILNSASIVNGLKMLVGFLLFNGLLNRQMVIFADGARDINNAVSKMLHYANYKVILDWYHLEKKCKEQLSMALRGSKIRNEFLDELLPCLWFGNVRGAIKLLSAIDPQKVRNYDVINYLVGYLERVHDTIPCYALRKQLGLRNSSNQGEKANDLIVSNRQKHNGMSWSNDGSEAFATVAAALHNGEMLSWLHRRDIGFNLRDNAA
jgi:hypothetical protein